MEIRLYSLSSFFKNNALRWALTPLSACMNQSNNPLKMTLSGVIFILLKQDWAGSKGANQLSGAGV